MVLPNLEFIFLFFAYEMYVFAHVSVSVRFNASIATIVQQSVSYILTIFLKNLYQGDSNLKASTPKRSIVSVKRVKYRNFRHKSFQNFCEEKDISRYLTKIININ